MSEITTNYRQLRQAIDQSFNLAEIKALCFDMGVDFEHIPGDNKLTKIDELLLYLQRNSQIHLLINLLSKKRPKIHWPNIVGHIHSSIRERQTASSSFSTAVSKYLEALQSTILQDFRRDQYVSLAIESLDSEDSGTVNALKNALQTSFEFEAAEFGKGGEIFTIEDAINKNRLVALLGEPGIGKTTSLRYLTLKFIDDFKDKNSNLIPIWISLGKWDQERKELPAIEFIYAEFLQLFDPEEINQQEFIEWLNAGELILFFDGLNELPQRERINVIRDNSDEHEPTQNQIDHRENSLLVLAREAQSRFIISCRVLEYTHYPHWREFLILPLNEKQIKVFIDNHLGDDSSQLEKMFVQQPQLKKLLRTPFFLRSIILLAQKNWQEIPNDRFQLVQFTCIAALHREIIYYPESIEQAIKSFGKGSHNLMSRGIIGSSFYVDRDYLHEDNSPDNIDDIHSGKAIQIVENAGLLIRVSENEERIRYRYLHQLIQEAFALLYLQQREKTEDKELQRIEALTEIGEIHGYWGLIRESQENLERAMQLCPVVGAEEKRSPILIQQSRLARQNRQTRQSLPLAQTAIELAQITNDKDLQARAYRQLGYVNEGLRSKKQAENSFKMALNLRKEIGDITKLAYEMLWGLGDFYANPNVYKIKKAIEYQKEALSLFESEENKLGMASAKEQLAHSYRLWGEVKLSEKYFLECIEEYDQLNKLESKALALKFLGILYRDMESYQDAERISQQVYELSIELSKSTLEFSILVFGLSWIYMFQKKFSRAMELIDESYKIAREQASPYQMITVYFYGYLFVNWQAKRFKEAAESYKLYQKEIDEEEKINSDIYKQLIALWYQLLGKRVSTNKLAYIMTYFFWLIFQVFLKIKSPTNPVKKYIWRFFWWLHTVKL